jgi:hypothetical protein
MAKRAMTQNYSLGLAIGGTFTGRRWGTKVLTTHRPAEGVIAGVRAVLARRPDRARHARRRRLRQRQCPDPEAREHDRKMGYVESW